MLGFIVQSDWNNRARVSEKFPNGTSRKINKLTVTNQSCNDPSNFKKN